MSKTALEKPIVSNNINLALNQNDLIDLVIEEKVSQLEPIIENIEKKIKSLYLELKEKQEALCKKELDKVLKASKKYKQFIAASTAINVDFKETMSISINTYSEDKTNIIGEHQYIDFDNVQTYKNPYDYAKRNSYNITIKYQPLDSVTFNFSSNAEIILSASIKFPGEVKGHDELTKEYLKDIFELNKILYKEQMSYLEFKYGEKRIKSKIVKASLSKSEEGQAILKMLQTATDIKLLG